MPNRGTSVCVPCRNAGHMGFCLKCGEPPIYMGTKWRAPKKTNETAWKRIEAGELWWDREAVAKAKFDENPYHKRWRERKVWLERLQNRKYRKSHLTDTI